MSAGRRITGRGPAREQRGFALVSGIFLITILFLLSAYLIGFRVHQDSSLALDALGTRAYAAARSGAEWGAYNSLRNGTCAASTALAFDATLAGYTATVTCSRSSYDEGGVLVTVDTVVANACNQPAAGNCPNPAPGVNYSERQITMTVAP
jgi:MSHA biogenesis protein MshP